MNFKFLGLFIATVFVAIASRTDAAPSEQTPGAAVETLGKRKFEIKSPEEKVVMNVVHLFPSITRKPYEKGRLRQYIQLLNFVIESFGPSRQRFPGCEKDDRIHNRFFFLTLQI